MLDRTTETPTLYSQAAFFNFSHSPVIHLQVYCPRFGAIYCRKYSSQGQFGRLCYSLNVSAVLKFTVCNKCQFSSLLCMQLRKPHYLKHDKIFKTLNMKILHCVFSSVMPQMNIRRKSVTAITQRFLKSFINLNIKKTEAAYNIGQSSCFMRKQNFLYKVKK